MTTPQFPFGSAATPRPPRRPDGDASLFVLGVYPSAFHVRWQPPAWAVEQLAAKTIGALAAADEPVVFWDGENPDPAEVLKAWRSEVGFVDGDDEGQWGTVSPAGNGTSGRPVRDRILGPLDVPTERTWFTDAIDTYFVKSGRGSQGAAMTERYGPFASAAGLPAASLPPRPSIRSLVALAVTEHRDRLRDELVASRAPTVVTLGEEARQVLGSIVDDADGPPVEALGTKDPGDAARYGKCGSIRVDGRTLEWMALVHPGQRTDTWTKLHDSWIAGRTEHP